MQLRLCRQSNTTKVAHKHTHKCGAARAQVCTALARLRSSAGAGALPSPAGVTISQARQMQYTGNQLELPVTNSGTLSTHTTIAMVGGNWAWIIPTKEGTHGHHDSYALAIAIPIQRGWLSGRDIYPHLAKS